MTQFLKKISIWLAKLAFWRKHAADAAPPTEAEPEATAAIDVAEPASDQPVAKPNWLARLKGLLSFRRRKAGAETEATQSDAEPDAERKPRPKASEEPEVPETKLGIFARLKQWLTFRRKTAATDTEADAETEAQAATSDETEGAAPKFSFAARLKRMLSFRRKPVEAEAEADDKTQVIEKSKVRSETAVEDEADAPPPSRLKRFLIRLRSKWVWIPALSLAVMGLASWVIVIMMHATHEKERLQAELKSAKKLLEQKQVAVVKLPAPSPPPQPAAPAKPEKQIDPAFNIVGHTPAPQSEEASGIDASDCVVKDKKSVSESLKNCITSFNEAVASTPSKSKKP